MFADPQTLTIASVAKTMPKIRQEGTTASYQTSDGLIKLAIRHTPAKDDRMRSLVRVDFEAVVTNPLDNSNKNDSFSFQVVLDRPNFGFTPTQMGDVWAALKVWLDATALGKLLGQES